MIYAGKPLMSLENKRTIGFEVEYGKRLVLKICNEQGNEQSLCFYIDLNNYDYDHNAIIKLTNEDPLLHFINSIYALKDIGSENNMKNIDIDTLLDYINSLNYVEIEYDFDHNSPERIKVKCLKEDKKKLDDLITWELS